MGPSRVYGPLRTRSAFTTEKQTLIETIYLDVAGPRSASRYTLLLEKLHAAQQAQEMHAAMAKRVALLHKKLVDTARRELETEAERLRKALELSRAAR